MASKKEKELTKFLFDKLGDELERFKKPLLPDWYDIEVELIKKEIMHMQEIDNLEIWDDTSVAKLFNAARKDFYLDAAHKIRNQILDWLGLSHDDVIMMFSKDFGAAGGHAVMEDWQTILIDSKYSDRLDEIGAILAHEIMHIYLYKHNVELPDKVDNEKLTDLATIHTGLGIIVLNGMTDWISHRQTFGYLDDKYSWGKWSSGYGENFLDYLDKNNILLGEVAGYIMPQSRGFISHGETVEITGKKSRYVQLDEEAGIGNFINPDMKDWLSGKKDPPEHVLVKKLLTELKNSIMDVKNGNIERITNSELKKMITRINYSEEEEEHNMMSESKIDYSFQPLIRPKDITILISIKSELSRAKSIEEFVKKFEKESKARDYFIKKYTQELLSDNKIKNTVSRLQGSLVRKLLIPLGLRKEEIETAKSLIKNFTLRKYSEDKSTRDIFFTPKELAYSLKTELELPYR